MEDIDAADAAAVAQAADVTQMNLGDDESIPEDLRGKSVKDVIEALKGREQALKLSEAARLQATSTPMPVAPAPVVEEPEKTDEEIAQIYEENPLQAMELMSARSVRRAERNLETRLGPLMNGTAASVEQQARTKYVDEFALFGEEIIRVAGSIPNAKAVLSSPAAWDELVALVRGRAGNFDKLYEHKVAKAGGVTRETVQQDQVAGVGFSDNSGGRGRAPTSVAGLDPIQKEIAEKMGLTPAEYVKWSKVS
jgi:hypothetical protein